MAVKFYQSTLFVKSVLSQKHGFFGVRILFSLVVPAGKQGNSERLRLLLPSPHFKLHQRWANYSLRLKSSLVRDTSIPAYSKPIMEDKMETTKVYWGMNFFRLRI